MKTITAVATLALALTACSDNAGPDLGTVTVMTRNIYVGAAFEPLLGAAAGDVPMVAASVWGQVQASNFPQRAGRLAAEIAAHRPAVVGLQEVSWFRRQSPGDLALGGSTPATTMVLDFLQILRDSLAARGLSYTVAAADTTSDIEAPVLTGVGAGGPTFDDIRWTDGDVILVRSDIAFTNPARGIFAAAIPLNLGGASVQVKRGWSAVTFTAGTRTYRFVNTHLESASDLVQVAQAQELLALLDAETHPVILVGDLNSDASGTGSATYGLVVSAGFGDVWLLAQPAANGFTCCFNETLGDPADALTRRLDLIMARMPVSAGALVSAQAEVLGASAAERTSSGLWPSDHAGVVGVLRFQP